jgi:hypothetical protein
MRLRGLAYIVGILPILTAYISYYIAVDYGHVPACAPNLHGCTSISSTGRHSPESLFFRSMMISTAVLMALCWLLYRRWLIKMEGHNSRQQNMMLLLGLVSSAFLFVYTLALGHIGEVYALQRRIGVTLFFSCGLLAQLLAANLIWKMVRRGDLELRQGLHKWLLLVCVLMLLTGLAAVPMSILFPGDGRVDNIIEWNYAVLMYLYFVVLGRIWSVTDFRL